jgi:Pentapeptide repeats (8 copies)
MNGGTDAAYERRAATPATSRRRLELRANCARCSALCCVAPAFSASADFAIDKPAGQPCPHLREDFRCSIHDRLRPRGFAGCAAFDCFGAGQQVTQVTFGGRDWRADPGLAAPMFAAFAVMRQLHELLWYLNEALALGPADPLRSELDEALAATERMTNSSPGELVKLGVAAHLDRANAILLHVSGQVRERAGGPTPDLRGADLAGKDLRGADLGGASLRGTVLIGADLRDADFSYVDLTGADLRGADLSGANLETSLFTSQPQLDSANGDSRTKLPSWLSRPSHWATPG